jgi:hypothetical protein
MSSAARAGRDGLIHPAALLATRRGCRCSGSGRTRGSLMVPVPGVRRHSSGGGSGLVPSASEYRPTDERNHRGGQSEARRRVRPPRLQFDHLVRRLGLSLLGCVGCGRCPGVSLIIISSSPQLSNICFPFCSIIVAHPLNVAILLVI